MLKLVKITLRLPSNMYMFIVIDKSKNINIYNSVKGT